MVGPGVALDRTSSDLGTSYTYTDVRLYGRDEIRAPRAVDNAILEDNLRARELQNRFMRLYAKRNVSSSNRDIKDVLT